MPFALLVIGLLLVITGANGTYGAMSRQLAADGKDFVKWGVAFGIIGGAGYIADLRGLSRAFMSLILIAMVLSNSKTGKGVIGNFQDAINKGPVASQATTSPESSATQSATDNLIKKPVGMSLSDYIAAPFTPSLVPGGFADTLKNFQWFKPDPSSGW